MDAPGAAVGYDGGEPVVAVASLARVVDPDSLAVAVFATHPSVESRVERLGCEIPDWARPSQPHRGR